MFDYSKFSQPNESAFSLYSPLKYKKKSFHFDQLIGKCRKWKQKAFFTLKTKELKTIIKTQGRKGFFHYFLVLFYGSTKSLYINAQTRRPLNGKDEQ